MAIDVKICGLKDAAAIETAIVRGARMLGFVCFPPSPRHLDPGDIARLAGLAKCRAETVAVTVDPDDGLVLALARACDWLQLHGDETPGRVATIRQLSGRRIIKAIRVGTAGDIEAARLYQPVVDMLLFDARPAPDANLPGGNGLAFDWTLLMNADLEIPWMLSGGLDRQSLAAAVSASGARSVDVSSGVEDTPGQKNLDKIAAFLEEARHIETKE